jgi:hypothetical protein
MAAKNKLRAELDALAQAIAGAASPGDAAGAGAPADPDDGPDFGKLIGDVEGAFATAAEDVEKIVAAYPLASLAVAFAIGLIAGRTLRRL